MKLLLDTQILLWFVNDDLQLNDHLSRLALKIVLMARQEARDNRQ
jgi:hypothetical protein